MKKVLMLFLMAFLFFSCNENASLSPVSGDLNNPDIDEQAVRLTFDFTGYNPTRSMSLDPNDVMNNNNAYQVLLWNEGVFYCGTVCEFTSGDEYYVEMDVVPGSYELLILVGQKLTQDSPAALLAVGKDQIMVKETAEMSLTMNAINYALDGFEGDYEQGDSLDLSLSYDLLHSELIGINKLKIMRDTDLDYFNGTPVKNVENDYFFLQTDEAPATQLTLSAKTDWIFTSNIDNFILKGEEKYITFKNDEWTFVFDGSYAGCPPQGGLSYATEKWVMPTHDTVSDVFDMMEQTVVYDWSDISIIIKPIWG